MSDRVRITHTLPRAISEMLKQVSWYQRTNRSAIIAKAVDRYISQKLRDTAFRAWEDSRPPTKLPEPTAAEEAERVANAAVEAAARDSDAYRDFLNKTADA